MKQRGDVCISNKPNGALRKKIFGETVDKRKQSSQQQQQQKHNRKVVARVYPPMLR